MTRTPPAQQTHDPRSDSTVTQSVVEAVADAKGISALEVNPPLATVIDPDALETFVDSLEGRSPGRTGSIEFVYSGHVVTVESDGTVDVSPLEFDG